MSKVLKKSNYSAGFTLAETLVAVVILVLISAAALPAAMNAYRNAVDAANAQVLLSTTVNALRDELSTAWNVSVSDGKTITYQSAATGDKSIISTDGIRIMLQEYSRETGEDIPGWWGGSTPPAPSPRPLVSDAMRRTTRNSNNYMTVTYSAASFDGTYVTITGLQVKRGDSVLAKMSATGLLIRVMTAEPTVGTGS